MLGTVNKAMNMTNMRVLIRVTKGDTKWCELSQENGISLLPSPIDNCHPRSLFVFLSPATKECCNKLRTYKSPMSVIANISQDHRPITEDNIMVHLSPK